MSAAPVEPTGPEGPAVRTPAAGRARRRRRATSEELVAAAERVASREGVSAITTRKIAEEAGVPLGTVHYWFSDKQELLEEVVRGVLARLGEAITATDRPQGGSTATEIRAGLQAAWDSVTQDDPGIQLAVYELTALAVRTPAMRELAARQYANYRTLAASQLVSALQGVDPERAAAVAELVAVTFDGLVLSWLADPEGTQPARVLDLLTELVFSARTAAP